MPRIAREAFANTPLATDTTAGDMSAADKAALDTRTNAATANAIAQRDSAGGCSFTQVNATLNGGVIETAWIAATLNSGFSNAPGYHAVQYRKAATGEVQLRGAAYIGNNGAVLTLPAGYWPAANVVFALPLWGTGSDPSTSAAVIGCVIDTNGRVNVNASQAGAVAAFDGVRFSLAS